MQELLSREVFGNTMLAYLISVALFCGVYIALPIVRVVLVNRLNRWAKRTTNDFDDFLVTVLREHVDHWVFFFSALYAAINALMLPESLQRIARLLFLVVVTFKAVQIAKAAIAYAITKWIIRSQQSNPNVGAVGRNLLAMIQIGLWSAAVLFVLDNLGIDVTAFVAGLGIGGVAVALAAQAVLGDAFSSFAIFMDRPFEMGDFIIVGDLMGTVEHVGFKTTRVRSLGGEQLVFANSDLTSSRIRNYKRMQERRVVFKLGIVYETRLALARQVPELIKGIITSEAMTRFDRAHFQSYGDFALIYEVVYYVLDADYNKYMDVQERINFRIKEAFEQAGISFAYPTQQVYVTRTEPGKAA